MGWGEREMGLSNAARRERVRTGRGQETGNKRSS